MTTQTPGDQLNSLRSQIDGLDTQIAKLLSERMGLAVKLASVKGQLGVPTQDQERENEVYKRVGLATSDTNIAKAIRVVYDAIMMQSRKLQTLNLSDKRSPSPFPVVVILGLGLIGGALARQIRRMSPDTMVIGIDKEDIVASAVKEGVIDSGAVNCETEIGKADLIILAASPNQNLELLKQIAPLLRKGQLVTDVTSTKSAICDLAEGTDLRGADFIGGHPCFGTEKSGFDASKDVEAEGRVFCLTPTSKSSEDSLKRLSQWLTILRLRVETIDATTHDAAMASVSHLLQLLIAALSASIADGHNEQSLKKVLSLSGTSFAQISRLADSPPEMWTEIVAQNRKQVAEALQKFDQHFNSLTDALATGNEADLAMTIRKLFEQARRVKRP